MHLEEKDMPFEIRHNMRGGEGTVKLMGIVQKDALPPKVRLASLVTLEKGCGIGFHEHSGEEEMFYVLSGEGILNDNGIERLIKAGDSHLCKDGQSHAVHNEKDEPYKMLAVVVLNR